MGLCQVGGGGINSDTPSTNHSAPSATGSQGTGFKMSKKGDTYIILTKLTDRKVIKW